MCVCVAYPLPVPQEVGAERTKMQSLEAGLRAELLASGHAQATLTQQLQLKVRVTAVMSHLSSVVLSQNECVVCTVY